MSRATKQTFHKVRHGENPMGPHGAASKKSGHPDQQGWDGHKRGRSSENLGFGSAGGGGSAQK